MGYGGGGGSSWYDAEWIKDFSHKFGINTGHGKVAIPW